MALIGLNQSGYHVKTSGLARSVGTKQTNDLALIYLKRNSTYHNALTVLFNDMFCTEFHGMNSKIGKVMGLTLVYET